ncbi:MBL fold metallo-hydrolase [Alkalicoccus luteus]|uniref:MBL fold metallo-hydrolase n=1 Tax=Alkalicoccus luteus TaxID=1237094 RepID=A0A969PT24_9BACI|nr:MBL fold metallo-hydrolase [Alkalicoccus luteus]NJP38579.1 MBL fold metallo-hydrolase [Alkalicoccus luteus]
MVRSWIFYSAILLMLAACGTEQQGVEETNNAAEAENDSTNMEEEAEADLSEESAAENNDSETNDASEENEPEENEQAAEEEDAAENTAEDNSAGNEELAAEPHGELSVHFIDVGQADATLFSHEYEGDMYHVLFDTGNWNRSDALHYLQDKQVEELQVMIGSHPHADHIGQMDKILESGIAVEEAWMSGDEATSDTFMRVMDAIERHVPVYEEPRAGDSFDIGALEIDVLHPAELTGDLHDGSLTMQFTYGDVSILLTGDAEDSAEQMMLDRGEDVKSDILQLGHHGSDTSTTQPFLEAVDPETVVYSAGENNSYGHPHAEVLQRVEDYEADLYGTDVNGTIVVTTDGETYNLETEQDGDPDVPANDEAAEEQEADEQQASNEEDEDTQAPDGCININEASSEALEEIVHIGPARAAELIEKRPFSSLEDMERIDGIAAGRLADIKEEGTACVP